MNKILKELRKKEKKTQKDIANFLDMSQQNYNHYETGKRKPTSENIAKLAKYYNTTTDIIMGIKEDDNDGITYPQKYVEITEEEKDMLKNYRELSPQRQLETANIIQAYKLFDKEKNGK